MFKRRDLLLKLLILLVIGGLYFSNQVFTIYGGDAGDLVSAIVTGGIAHPPGYPLYTLLGVLINKIISSGTAAWRVGFLSSIPAIFTLFFLFDLLFYLSKQRLISLIAVGVLALSYPFWLYSEVVEVFSLNNLFMVTLLWCFFRFYGSGKLKYLYAGAFIFGLSLTHHHIILFLVPALFFAIYQQRKLLSAKVILSCILLILLGLTPYLYVFFAASSNSPINWMGEATISNFLELVTRASYGTFKAGAFIVNEPSLRLLDLYGFGNFFYKDFRILGVILFLLGFVYLLKKERKIFLTLFLAFASYLFFLFYASFPLSENFIVGTFERFVLPLYILATFFIAFGLIVLTSFIEKYLAKMLNKEKKETVSGLVLLLFFLYPVGLLILNFPKISILTNDFTAENFGRDLLGSVPAGSIILIGIDTPLFDSQYVYFTEKKWSEVKLVHIHKLVNPKTENQVKKIYPELNYPGKNYSQRKMFDMFIDANYQKYPIFSKQAFVSSEGVWIPWGLLFRYFRNDDIPTDDYIFRENQKIWDSYHDPLSGSLSRYQNLLLADTLRHYSIAHQEIGFWEAKRGYSDEAEKHLLAAEKLTPEDLDSYNILSQVYILQNKCDKAAEQINFRLSKDRQDPASYLLLSLNYSLCYKDPVSASQFQKLYEEKQKQTETSLRKL